MHFKLVGGGGGHVPLVPPPPLLLPPPMLWAREKFNLKLATIWVTGRYDVSIVANIMQRTFVGLLSAYSRTSEFI